MLRNHFVSLAQRLNADSEEIRRLFATHLPSGGANREAKVASLLRDYILPRAGIGDGLILSSADIFSNQADVLLYDNANNKAITPQLDTAIWLIEAVYAMIEVKTQMTPSTLHDSVKKCIKFKQLPRVFADSFGQQKIKDSLFVIWAYECPNSLLLAKKNIEDALTEIRHHEWPDFIIVPDKFIWRGGHYFDLSKNGEIGSTHRATRMAEVGGNEDALLVPPCEMIETGGDTLIAFLTWLNSWLFAVGPRRPDLSAYIPRLNYPTI